MLKIGSNHVSKIKFFPIKIFESYNAIKYKFWYPNKILTQNTPKFEPQTQENFHVYIRFYFYTIPSFANLNSSPNKSTPRGITISLISKGVISN